MISVSGNEAADIAAKESFNIDIAGRLVPDPDNKPSSLISRENSSHLPLLFFFFLQPSNCHYTILLFDLFNRFLLHYLSLFYNSDLSLFEVISYIPLFHCPLSVKQFIQAHTIVID